MGPLDGALLPAGVRARFVEGVNGLRVHLLEAGDASGPLVLLLHGFPELAYSWRGVMPALAAAGAHVVAPDLRGYGRTTGGGAGFVQDLAEFGLLNLLRDALSLVAALGRERVALVVGHDFGASVAATAALVRPDVFGSVVLMSAPFGGAPAHPAGVAPNGLAAELAALRPARKHYHWYYATPAANADMQQCPQGVHDFLRAYYHHKSADWPGNAPHPLGGWSAEELAKLPTYYVMRLEETMAQTVAHEMPSAAAVAACGWLPEAQLRVYSEAYARTGFQGGLNWYRARVAGVHARELATFSGRSIDVPSGFIAGRQDWGVFQKAGDFEAMQGRACTRMSLCTLLEGAGHWVQQERPEAVAGLLVGFFRAHGVV